MHKLHPYPRKWPLATRLLVASAVVVVCILVYFGLRLAFGAPEQAGQLAKNDDLTQGFDISYPVFKIETIDTQLKAFADNHTNEFIAKIKDRPYDSRNKLTLDFSVPHIGERTLSVIFSQKEEMVNKEPSSSQYMLNFDIQSGKQLALMDIFREDADARGVVATILYDYFGDDQTDDLNDDQLAKLRDMTFDNVRDFLLYEDKIVLYLNPEDLTNVQPATPIAIKKDILVSVLSQPYAGTDTSRKPDSGPQPAYAINELPRPDPPAASQSGGGRIALTFDDGPSEHTSRLLDILAQHQSRATFYVLGHLAQAYSGELQRMVREGHEVGNHSWMHANLTQLAQEQLEHEVGDTQRAIQAATGGYTPRTIRPPYGATNDTVKAFSSNYGLHEVLWSVDPNDWQTRDSQLIYDRIIGGAADGRVILLHDIYGSSVDAAIRAIPDLKARGFQLMTVSELYGY